MTENGVAASTPRKLLCNNASLSLPPRLVWVILVCKLSFWCMHNKLVLMATSGSHCLYFCVCVFFFFQNFWQTLFNFRQPIQPPCKQNINIFASKRVQGLIRINYTFHFVQISSKKNIWILLRLPTLGICKKVWCCQQHTLNASKKWARLRDGQRNQ